VDWIHLTQQSLLESCCKHGDRLSGSTSNGEEFMLNGLSYCTHMKISSCVMFQHIKHICETCLWTLWNVLQDDRGFLVKQKLAPSQIRLSNTNAHYSKKTYINK
jgi:hypothetical protein